MGSLPLGAITEIEIQRGLTTSSVAIFHAPNHWELFQDGKEALCFIGADRALRQHLIAMVRDQKTPEEPNRIDINFTAHQAAAVPSQLKTRDFQ